jgi:uncharacterized membrane protein (DUF4010 family)
MTPSLLFLQHLGLALLMGSLIGLERERNHQESLPHEFGGIRTMALVSVLGFLVYSVFSQDSLLFALFTGAYLLLLVASYVMSSYQNKNSGATTEIAGFFAYFIGILVGMDQEFFATIITLLVVLILYFKAPLHRFAHQVGKEEFYDTIKFIVVVFVVLPLAPNATFGPLNVLNPYEIWLVVVLISSISFASYVAIKLVGPKKGIGLSGFLGGFISSTAVSMSFSELSKRNEKVVNPFIFAILIASSAMFIRVLLTLSVLNPDLVPYVNKPLLGMAFTGFILCAYYWFKKGGQPMKSVSVESLRLHSPFQLTSALKFGLFFAAMVFISKFAVTYFGSNGIYLTAFLSGIVDVDAISISMSNLSAMGSISPNTAAIGVTIAAMTNTLSKALIVLFFGSHEVGVRILLSMFFMIVVGFAIIFVLLPNTYGFAFF